ncbi:MAG: MFS transporter [Marinifilaceae bacterium]
MTNNSTKTDRNPWGWVPSLYFAEGLPYVIVMTVAVILYKRLGISNTDIALYTSWLYLPWVIKPFWSPLVDILKTKRWWIVGMQLLIGAGLAGVALTIPGDNFFKYTLAFFWLLAFSSATHDIAADGFYMLGLDEHKQAYFVGIRSTFYRVAMITGQGLLIILAGFLETSWGLDPIEIQLTSQPGQVSEIQLPKNLEGNEEAGDLHFILDHQRLDIATHPISEETYGQVFNWVQQQNAKLGFVNSDKDSTPIKKEDPSWSAIHIKQPLENFLRQNLGEGKMVSHRMPTNGNIALLGIHLSSSPEIGEEIALNLNRAKGDKSFRLLSSDRLVFNEKNWNRKAWLLFQLDPKLKKEAYAVYQGRAGNIPLAWTLSFFLLSGLFLLLGLYHRFFLPYPQSDFKRESNGFKGVFMGFGEKFFSFFRQKDIGVVLGVLLLYRLGESQLVKLAAPFLLDAREIGGLGLTTGDVGFIYGTVGLLCLTIGGILGGWLASRNGLKYWMWWMVIAINLPNLVYVYFSYVQPESFFLISAGIALEQFGYGFGFTAFMLYLIYVAEGEHKTTHFAIGTGLMAVGMMIPGMMSGWLQEIIGYRHFFIWVMICTIPPILMMRRVKIPASFGRNRE